MSNITKIGFCVEHLVDGAKVYFDNFTINVEPPVDQAPETGDSFRVAVSVLLACCVMGTAAIFL